MKSVAEKIICEHYGVTRYQILGRGRTGQVAWARQVGYWIFRDCFQMSGPTIASWFGRSQPRTVYAGIQNVQDVMDTDRVAKADLLALKAQIMGAVAKPIADSQTPQPNNLYE